LYHVIGVDVPTAESYWKIAKVNAGLVPFASPDHEFAALVHDAVQKTGNMKATASETAYELADVIVVDVGLDVRERYVADPKEIHLLMDSFQAALRAVGRRWCW
jgi:UDP-glucose 6-dehydrogenase